MCLVGLSCVLSVLCFLLTTTSMYSHLSVCLLYCVICLDEFVFCPTRIIFKLLFVEMVPFNRNKNGIHYAQTLQTFHPTLCDVLCKRFGLSVLMDGYPTF